MALRLVNSTPGSDAGLLLPGTPLVFGLRSTTGAVDSRSLGVKMGFTNILGHLFTDPRADPVLARQASVELHAVERYDSGAVRGINSATNTETRLFRIGSVGDPRAAGVFEVTVPVQDFYSPVMASVTFLCDPWILESPYWSNRTNVAPVYAGLEIGIKNTGVFAYLRDDGALGSMVVGGPLQAFGAPRPGQVEIPEAAWLLTAAAAATGDERSENRFTIFFLFNPETMRIEVWKQGYGDAGPVQMGSQIVVGDLGTFQPERSAFPQRRSGPSPVLRLFFGAGTEQAVSFYDFAIYKFFASAVASGSQLTKHSLSRLPDSPLVYRSSDSTLLTDKTAGRWYPSGAVTPTSSFWFQPGRKTAPLYTQLQKSVLGDSFLRREEPSIVGGQDGFLVEGWVSGEAKITRGIEQGFGFRASDGAHSYRVTAISTPTGKTYGLQRLITEPEDPDLGFYLPRGTILADDPTFLPAPVISADHSALRLLRLAVDRRRGLVELYVEDPDAPILRVPLANVSCPLPSPLSPTVGTIDVGHFGEREESGVLNIAALSVLNRYASWDKLDEDLPAAAAAPFTLDELGGGTTSFASNGKLVIHKTSSGAHLLNRYTWRRSTPFTYLRGCQVDFRARVVSYSDGLSQDTPNVWIGAGISVYLGASESDAAQHKKIHVGFFDCGTMGRKVAIVPNDGLADILQQTSRGRKHSATWNWSDSTQPKTLRLVYRPGKSVELWDSTLFKSPPLISIPWAEFEVEDDPLNQAAGVAFGAFNPAIESVVEWDYVRWGWSTGYEHAVTQEIMDTDAVQDGRAYYVIQAEESGA